MKNSKLRRALLLLACAVLLVSLSVGATLAYLTDSKTVTNTFTVGNVLIDLDEAPVDLNGNVIEGNRGKANQYKLLPGHTYAKDPTVHVLEGSENCYVFVKLENGLADIESTIEEQMVGANKWVKLYPDEDIYYYGTEEAAIQLAAGDSRLVFATFTIDGDVEHDELVNYQNAKIIITAYAIQADGFDAAKPEDIWTAFFDQELNPGENQ